MMLIAGAGGHAIELFEILCKSTNKEEIFFFDDITSDLPDEIFGRKILKSISEINELFSKSSKFVLGVGAPNGRKILYEKLMTLGGQIQSVVSPEASIGSFEVILEPGLNIMPGAVITNRIRIGFGSLIHVGSSVHHDVEIGEFCEISPGARILGRAKLGSMISVGSNAVILPKVKIGDHAIIGAGAVVTKNVADGICVVGIPALPIRIK